LTAFVLIISKEDKKLMAENAGSTNKERNKCKAEMRITAGK
jgi:hypothetical protein